MHGVPIGIKDLFHTAGEPSTFATLVYKDFTANEDATIVARLKQAGAIIVGRLHLHEGAYGEHHPELPKALNPWNNDYWPGGSSSGSGAAMAAGLAYGSLGTDTGGSIRFPSSANGVTGLKVTWGRTSRKGAFPLSDSLDTIGPMCRSAEDCAAMLGAFAGFDPGDPPCLREPVPDYLGALNGISGMRGKRSGVDRSIIDPVEPEMKAAIYEAIEIFKDLGAEIVPVTVPNLKAVIPAHSVVLETEAARFHKETYEANKDRFGPALAGCIERGLAHDGLTVAGAYIEQDRYKGLMRQMFEGIDALASPVTSMIGFRYDEMEETLANIEAFLEYTGPFNFTGSPSITFPIGLAKFNVPIGMQLVGPHLSDAPLLAMAHAFQQATEWHLMRPDLSCHPDTGVPNGRFPVRAVHVRRRQDQVGRAVTGRGDGGLAEADRGL